MDNVNQHKEPTSNPKENDEVNINEINTKTTYNENNLIKNEISNTFLNPLNFKRGELIASGCYGKVYKCLDLTNGRLLAVKNVKIKGNIEKIRKEIIILKEEIEILKKISHKNIVKYFYTDICEDNSSVDIVFEYISGGSISSVLSKFGKFDERLVCKYTEEILEGLSYLHSLGITHRDIKGDNILIDSDSTIKLSDFGAAKQFINDFGQNDELELSSLKQNESREVFSKSLASTPHWMAPEVVLQISHGFPADIWSVGCVVIEMLTGKPPYTNITKQTKEILKLILEGKSPMYPSSISPNCKDFLDACLKHKPEQRLKANELLQLPFITNPMSNNVHNSRNDTTNNDPRNHSSHLISNSEILVSFFGKSVKQLGPSSPSHLKILGSDLKKSELKSDGNEENTNNLIILDKKNLKKNFLFNKSNISKEEIEEEKKEDDFDEKEQRLNKQKAYNDAIRKDAERIKMQKKLSQDDNLS